MIRVLGRVRYVRGHRRQIIIAVVVLVVLGIGGGRGICFSGGDVGGLIFDGEVGQCWLG